MYKKRPLITGSSGFIGSHLALNLMNENPILFEKGYSLAEIDWGNVSKIYHLAASTSTYNTDVTDIYYNNIKLSVMIFEKAIEYKIPVVYASSAAVYGNSENWQINPLNQYALSKAMVDQWVKDNMNRFYSVVGLRFFNVYHPVTEIVKGNQASPIYTFEQQAKYEGEIRIFEGSELFFRDFVHVNDVVTCLKEEYSFSGIFDVGTGMAHSFQYVAEKTSKMFGGVPIRTIPFPEHLKGKYQEYTLGHYPFSHKFLSLSDYFVQREKEIHEKRKENTRFELTKFNQGYI